MHRTLPGYRICIIALGLSTLLGSACTTRNAARDSTVAPTAATTSAQPVPAQAAAGSNRAMDQLWSQWNDPATQRVAPFQIFDNLYYVGMEWVAAYLLVTERGLVLIDSLYGAWTGEMIDNIRSLGFEPANLAYVIVTHGHFDHAGGAARLQSEFGAKVVMTAADWALAAEPPADPRFAMVMPARDIVATDGDIITLGSTQITMLETPGHTAGVLSLRYQVFDNGKAYEAITLGGVGRNFSGVETTQSYINSYQRLLRDTTDVSVSLPNHAAMAQVFERGKRLQRRSTDAPHPFVDQSAYLASLQSFLTAGRDKLQRERSGTAKSALEELSDTLN